MLHKDKCSFNKTTRVLVFMLALVLCAFGAMTAMAQTDTTPPTFDYSTPADGATKVDLALQVVCCYFNENEILDAEKCKLDLITFKDSSGEDVVLDDVYGKDIQLNQLVITPKAWLKADTTYIINIPYGAIQDHAGNPAEAVTITFSTGEEIDLPDTVPAVKTGAATAITGTSATLNGTIENNGGAPVTEYGFIWTADNTNWQTVVIDTNDYTGQFSYDITGLTAGGSYSYKAFARNSEGSGYGDQVTFATSNPPSGENKSPTVKTNEAEVNGNTAALNGSIISSGGADIAEYGFEYSSDFSTWTKRVAGTNNHIGSYSADLGELSEGTTYYYKSYAVNSVGTGYGYVSAFSTATDADTVISAPIDVAGEAGSLVQVPIKLNSLGNVAGLQFDIKCDNGLLTYESFAAGDFTPADEFSTNLNELENGAVRVLIYNPQNDANIEQGEGSVVVLSFRVAQDAQPGDSCALKLSGFEAVESDAGIIENVVAIDGFFAVPQQDVVDLPTVQTLDAANITKVSATIKGMVEAAGSSAVTEYGFEWTTDQANWTKEVLGDSEPYGAFSKDLSGLTENTTYYFKSYAVNDSGTAYGAVKSFTTLEAPTVEEPTAPVVETKDASSVDRTSAVLNGRVVGNGGAALNEYGFQWSKDQAEWTTELVGTEDVSGNFSFKLSNLQSGTTYYFKAFAGNEIDRTYGDTLNFKTKSSSSGGGGGGGSSCSRPVVKKYDPAKDAKNVAVDAKVSVTFDIKVAKVSNDALDKITIEDADGNEVGGIDVTIDDDILTIDHDDFALNTEYTVTIPEDTVRCSKSNSSSYYNKVISWKFNTITGQADNEPGINCTFVDVPNSHWAYDVITDLCRQEIISGYPDGTFKPANNITRAEFAKIIVEAMELAEEKPVDPSFTDVSSNAWYYGYVEAAAKAGLVKGYNSGQFMPNAQITREQIAAILVRALDKESTALANASAATDFADDQAIAAWARGYVVTAVAEGLVGGYPDNTFGPQKNATRAEASAMISRFLEK
ncbi:Endoglucanase precursor [Sporotomaculum syntrophicum]|uniref:Endoglucanase n=1 Tax=Sporotomaculum syntrophicum TaxID=182264 RepID=A0A9D2WRI2_9FIRM|nr:S-layer homology domain-containing protein [Sporotomaculum syntrophicum]KAF1086044.1 Endoglucanase precursor [Sporotomaculum syntrophicum]